MGFNAIDNTQQPLVKMILDVTEDDQLLPLITCVGDDDERLVVAARRLREGETADRLIMRVE